MSGDVVSCTRHAAANRGSLRESSDSMAGNAAPVRLVMRCSICAMLGTAMLASPQSCCGTLGRLLADVASATLRYCLDAMTSMSAGVPPRPRAVPDSRCRRLSGRTTPKYNDAAQSAHAAASARITDVGIGTSSEPKTYSKSNVIISTRHATSRIPTSQR